jgi:hypothetical protein
VRAAAQVFERRYLNQRETLYAMPNRRQPGERACNQRTPRVESGSDDD